MNSRRSPQSTEDSGELLSGFIRLHVLHHATEGPLVGLWMIDELKRHGYKISPGTLYPMLHALEHKGLLRSAIKRSGKRFWREYRATARGRKALDVAKAKLRELFGELIEEPHSHRKTAKAV
jgi:DNA-binding PadR family transcriptional regulator